jgi:hypothetical protein
MNKEELKNCETCKWHYLQGYVMTKLCKPYLNKTCDVRTDMFQPKVKK